MSEYLSKEEIKKWRSSVEKITLEEYAARLGKKIQEEKKTNDLADMLYSHYNPSGTTSSYDSVTKLEKIELTTQIIPSKPKKSIIKPLKEVVAQQKTTKPTEVVLKEELTEDVTEKVVAEKPSKSKNAEVKATKTDEKTADKSEKKSVQETSAKKEVKKNVLPKAQPAKTTKSKSEKQAEPKSQFASLNTTFSKALTDREEKVLEYFISKKGEIVYAKDLAELLDLKRDYIYKYIKNLRAKMSNDIIANADNGGFVLN